VIITYYVNTAFTTNDLTKKWENYTPNATTKRWQNIAPIFETKEWVCDGEDVWT
jgi:hypothetical protein